MVSKIIAQDLTHWLADRHNDHATPAKLKLAEASFINLRDGEMVLFRRWQY
jgi:hypothetical protein